MIFDNIDVRTAIHAMTAVDSRSGVGQDTYVIEECSELIKELTKRRRGKGNDSDIIDEACDVLTTVLVLLHSMDVKEQTVCDKIVSKCRRAIDRYYENGEV